jgi:uncharacterized protein
MSKMVLEDIKEKILPILQETGVTRAVIFGSVARGEQTNTSDVDILVDLPENATLIDLVGLKQDLEEELKRTVDVIEYDGIDPLLKDAILIDQYPLL